MDKLAGKAAARAPSRGLCVATGVCVAALIAVATVAVTASSGPILLLPVAVLAWIPLLIVGFVLAVWLTVQSLRCHRKRALAAAILIAFLGGAALGASVLERAGYVGSSMWQMPALAAAINWTEQENKGSLPDTLEEIEATGLYGDLPYRLPASGWEGWKRSLRLGTGNLTGPQPHYVPVKDWDGNTLFIVALSPRIPCIGPYRRYAMIGDTSAHKVPEAEVQQLLVEDDAKRRQAGQPFLWADVNWR